MAQDRGVVPARDAAEIDAGECWTLLEGSALGRFAVHGERGGLDIFPMNYLVHAGGVFVRSASDAKLRAISAHPAVAFEVDGETDVFRWSVVVHGQATLLSEDPAIRASGVRDLVSWSPTAKFSFIHLVPESVTGRKFSKAPVPARVHLADVRIPGQRGASARKPQPIPHFPPAWSGE